MVLAAFTHTAAPHQADAHEFWLEASDYAPQTDATIAITLRNGQFFKGNSLPFISDLFTRFVIKDGKDLRKVEGVLGDDPAARVKLSMPGMAVIAYQSKAEKLTFETWEKFTNYLSDEGLENILPRHLARGLGKTGTKETYIRCAKMLVSAGRGGGHDSAVGLPLELIAERNPYSLPAGAALPVRLLLRGKPLAGSTVKVFDSRRPNEPRRYVTDREGRVRIAAAAGGNFLLSAVYMFEPAPDIKADWSSFWASLTFARPD